jgi:polygalacturonase
MASSIQLLRSNISQERPFPGNLLDGQPAINTNPEEPGLFFKANDGTLIKIGPATVTSDGNPPNSGAVGQTGNTTGELWLDKSISPPVLKIFDGSTWIDASAVSTVADGSITEAKLASNSVSSAKIIDGSIINADVNANAGIVASKLSFTQAGSGAIQRTVDSKLKDAVSVKDFGAVGDGVTDDTATIQAAIDAVGASGGGLLLFPAGTYVVTSSLNIQFGNIELLSEGATIDATNLAFVPSPNPFGNGAVFRFATPFGRFNTTLASTAAENATTLALTSAVGANEGDFISCRSTEVQYRNAAGLARFNDQNIVKSVSNNNVVIEVPLSYPLTVSPYTVTVQIYKPIKNIVVDGFVFIGGGVKLSPTPNGDGQCAVFAIGVQTITVRNCKTFAFQGIAIGFNGARDVVVSQCYMEGIPQNIPVVENQNSGFYGAYAFRSRGVLFTECFGNRVRHIFDAFETYQITQSNSNAQNTHRAAFGTHEGVYDLLICNNTATNCNSGVLLRALTAQVVSNQLFGNEILGFRGTPTISTAAMSAADPGRAKFLISGNVVNSNTTTNGAIQFGGSYDLVVCSNNLITAKNGAGIRMSGDSAKNAVFTNNTISAGQGISFITGSNEIRNYQNILIQGNTITDYRTNMVVLLGSTSMQTPANNIKIIDNFGVPVPNSSGVGILIRAEGFYGDNIVVRGNTQWGDTDTVVGISPNQLYRFKGYPVIELNDQTLKPEQANRSIGYFASGAAPSNSTVFRSSVLDRVNPSSGGPNYWVVVRSGTEGSFSGVTGTISIGSNILTMAGNNETKAYAGSYINVNGAGTAGGDLRVRIIALSDDFTTATLESNAITSVTGAIIDRSNPIISAGANLS